MKRIVIGGILHETNTVNPHPTTLDDCRVRGLYFGNEVIAALKCTRTEIGGFLDGLAGADVEIVPALYTCPLPAGKVSAETIDTLVGALTDTLIRYPADGVLLALHGAMVTAGHDDGDGWILSRVRAVVGEGVQVIVTLDLHATLTEDMARYADGAVVYRTYPHIDLDDRGREAARLMLAALDRRIRPVVAIAKRPLLIGPPHNVLPDDMPMRLVFNRAREIESEIPGVLACCPAHGFMQQDVPEAGAGVIVTADGDYDLARRCAGELADVMFAERASYFVDLPDAETAVRMARASDKPPVAIADAGDNIGAGTPGDGTALLREILRQGVDTAFVQLCDPEAARTAVEAGVGARVDLEVGGKSNPLYGPPVNINGIVRTVFDGRFRNREGCGCSAGVAENMGLTARVDIGGVTLVLTTHRIMPNNAMHAYAVGVFPEDYRMTVCKGGLAFRDAYRPPLANSHIQCNTPGYSSPDIAQFGFTRIPRPIYPLDDI